MQERVRAHKRFVGLGVILLAVVLGTAAHGATYYVNGATGNDANNGTSSTSPWKTIQKAADAMPAGSTCLVAPGTYTTRVRITRSGTAGSPLAFKGSGAGVVVHGFTVSGSATVQYVTIEGFEVTLPRNSALDTETAGSGIYLRNTQHCEVRNNYIHHTLREGIMIFASAADDSTNSAYNKIVGNRIEYAGGYAGITLNGAAQLVEDNEISHTIQHPLYPRLSTAGGADADGIQFAGRDHVFRGNYIHDISTSDRGNVDPHPDAFYTHGPAYNILIERNTIDLPTATNGSQAAMISQAVRPTRDITFRYNLVSAYRGFNVWGLDDWNDVVVPLYRVKVENNTFVNVRDYDIELHDCPNSTVKNNAISATGRYLSTNSSPATGKNAVPGSLPLRSGDLRVSDPMYADPAGGDYSLRAGSPLIDSGLHLGHPADLEGNPVPQGAGPDIGALEYMP